MLSLTNSSESLKLSLSGAVSATEATYLLSERDGSNKPLKTNIGQTMGATAVTIASGSSPSRFFDNLMVYNADSATIVATLTYVNSAGTSIVLFSQTMLTKDIICFDFANLSLTKTNSAGQSGTAVAVAQLDGVTAGTVTASKALVVDANKDLATLRNLTSTNYDAGSSGVAGTVDIFPTTAAKGKLAISAGDSAGDTTTSIVNASQAGARTYTIPDALASAQFLLGQQGAVARAATNDGLTTGTIADAGILQFITVTSANANNIIVLPTPTPGTIIVLHVAATGYELRTSDPATIAINGGTGAAAESAIAANTTVLMICATATSWKGLQLGSDGTLAKVEVAAP